MDSPAGNRTRVFRVTGGDTYHYTTEDDLLGKVVNIKCICNIDLLQRSAWRNFAVPISRLCRYTYS